MLKAKYELNANRQTNNFDKLLEVRAAFLRDAVDIMDIIGNGTFKKIGNQRMFLDHLAKKLNITCQDGWYNVTYQTLKQHGGKKLLDKYNGSPSKLLQTVYSEYVAYL